MKTPTNQPGNVASLKEVQVHFDRNTDFGMPEAGFEFLRKGKSIGFVVKGISGTNEYIAGSFGASGDKQKLISQYEAMYVHDRGAKIIRRRTERKVTNLELIIKSEIGVELERKSEKRKIIVVTPIKFGADGGAPIEYEVEILNIETPKDAEMVTDDTKARTEDLLFAGS